MVIIKVIRRTIRDNYLIVIRGNVNVRFKVIRYN